MDFPQITETNYTYKEYMNFYRSVGFRRHAIITGVMLAIYAAMSTYSHDIAYFAIFAAVYALIFIMMHFIVRKQYKSAKLMQDAMLRFTFYEDYFTAESDFESSNIKYDMLHKIIETKSNFYLYISANQGHIIVKANCSDELCDFLHNMAQKKRKKKV